MSLHVQPEQIASGTTVLKRQSAHCFELSILLTSYLLAAGYDAYVVSGYATQDYCQNNLVRTECPHVPDISKVRNINWKNNVIKTLQRKFFPIMQQFTNSSCSTFKVLRLFYLRSGNTGRNNLIYNTRSIDRKLELQIYIYKALHRQSLTTLVRNIFINCHLI